MPNKKLSPRDKKIIYGLYLEGKSQAKIAALFEVSQSTISYIIKEMDYERRLLETKGNHDMKLIP